MIHTASVSSDPAVMNKYIAGFNECTNEVTSYLNSIDGMTTEVRSRMINHLADCLHRTNTPQPQVTMVTAGAGGNTDTSQQQLTLAACAPAPLQIQQPSVAPNLVSMGNICVISPDSSSTSTTVTAQTQSLPTVMTALPQQPIPVQLVPAKLASGDTVYILANTQQQLPVINTNVNLAANTNIMTDLTTQNINQNVTVLNNVMQGNVLKLEPVTNTCPRLSSSTSSVPVLYSPQSTTQPLENRPTCSPVSSNDDICFTDESASSACQSSSFEFSTGDKTDDFSQNTSGSALSSSGNSSRLSLEREIATSIATTKVPVGRPQQVFQLVSKQAPRSVSSTITRPQSPDSSFETASTSKLNTTSSNTYQRESIESYQSREQPGPSNPGPLGPAWRPW